MRMFVKKSDTVVVTVFVWEIGDNLGASSDKAEVPKGTETEEVNFTFKRPSYDDSRRMMQAANFSGDVQSQQFQLDPTLFQDQILKVLLKDWDINDENGNKIECNQRAINDLEPPIARAASTGVMDKIEL